MNQVVKICLPQLCVGIVFLSIYRTWGLDFFPFNCILFLSQLFFTNYQTKPNWNPASLVFFLWTSLVALIEGLELDLSFLFSEMSLSQNHMLHSSPHPAPRNEIGQIKRIFFLSFILLPGFDWLFPFCQMQSVFLFWLSSELFGFISWKI